MHKPGRYALLLVSLTVIALALSACSSGSGRQGTATTVAGQPAGTDAAAPTATSQRNADSATAQAPTTVTTSTVAPTSGPTAAAPTATTGGAANAGPTSAPTQPAAQAGSVPGTGGQTNIPKESVTAFPDPTAYTWTEVVGGMERPLDLAFPADGSGRMFVVQQKGVIRVAQNGALLPDPFLDIQRKVGSQGNEQGLLGLALHPDYAKNGFFYINYTDLDGNTVIARYNASKDDTNKADPGSEKILLQVQQPYPNHNGGSMVFGPDGYLYMGLGDGGSGGDPQGHGQSLDTYLGKLLRVDVNNGDSYAIPKDNPFANGGGKPEIWAYGLRNPWRFSFDRLTGDLYIGDVGQDQWEEIDFLPAGSPGGANFGWNYREGTHPFRGSPPANANLIDPIFDYSHGYGCSVTGGVVYRGQALPEFRGIYLFSDYCSGRIWGLLRGADGKWQSQQLYQSQMNIDSFGQDLNGEVYAVSQASGAVYRLDHK